MDSASTLRIKTQYNTADESSSMSSLERLLSILFPVEETLMTRWRGFLYASKS